MDPIRKLTVAEQAAARLAEGIASGEVTGMLPGSRELTRRLGVSPASLKQALTILIERGVLFRHGAARRYVVADLGGDVVSSGRPRKLWIMEPIESVQPSGLPVEMLKRLESRLARMGWRCEWSMEVVDETRSHAKHWSELLRARRPDAMLLIGPHRSTAKWASTCGVPACCFGGDTSGLGISTLAFDTTHMLETALRELFALGHRDVFLPLTVRTPGFVERIHRQLESEMSGHGLVFSREWHSPVAEAYSPDALMELVERRFKKRPPTAMLSFGSSILTLMGYLVTRGYRVPRDVSLVNLGGYQDIVWLRPQVAHFDFEWHKAARIIERWLARGPEVSGNQQWRIKPRWVQGHTLARAVG